MTLDLDKAVSRIVKFVKDYISKDRAPPVKILPLWKAILFLVF